MGRIIRFNPDRHEETRTLLPWYLNGQLDADEHARVEAHLRDCSDCQAEARLERQLSEAVTELPIDADQGWNALRRRIAGERRGPLARLRQTLGRPRAFGWAIAAQFVLMAGLAVFLVAPHGRTSPPTVAAEYHALGSARPAPAGDVIVIFQADARTHDLTRVLRDTGARLVDGPTAADAYVLQVDPAQRAKALGRLRADATVAMAEPIDPAERP